MMGIKLRSSLLGVGMSLAAALTASQSAMAQDAPVATATSAPTPGGEPSDKAVVNLIRLLVQQGVITQQAADALVAQAEYEANIAKAAAGPAAPAPGVIRVPYVPQVVKDQIRDEVREEVLARAQNEGWTQAGAVPGWVNRIELNGDIRVRSQSDLYSDTNSLEFIDYATFNSAGPFDINPGTNKGNPPLLNTRQDRLNTLSVRARLGMKVKVSDTFTVNVRLATGRDSSPVTTTQAFGASFGKKDFWLDQAYVTFQPTPMTGLIAGRMPNPFFKTDMIFDEDLNLDGVAINLATLADSNGLNFFATTGAFPIEYLTSNFPGNSLTKTKDQTKWLYAAQAGARWQPNDDMILRGAVAYYNFAKVRGHISEPCALYAGVRQCSTDFTRPAFMQRGNTLFNLRNIAPDPANPLNYAQPQFVGLSYDYNILDLTAEFEARIADYRKLIVQASMLRNLGYERKEAFKGAGFSRRRPWALQKRR